MGRVEDRLRRRIEVEGPIPFAVFMEEALYGAGGYYTGSSLPIGEEGDFVTAASHSPLFGAATARLLERLDDELGRPADFLEIGYGNGDHLRAVVGALAPSPRRLLACDRFLRPVPPGVETVVDPEAIPPSSVSGLVFSFELFDAFPVHRLVGADDGLEELWVDLDETGELVWCRRGLSDPALADLLPAPLEPGQIADLAPGWRPFYRALAERLEAGLIVTCDYGFEGRRLLDVRVRRYGTLACYRRQRVHRNALESAGEQDLTAHVDFSALIAEGEAAGLETLAFTRLAPWLAALGFLAGLDGQPPAERLRAMQVMALDGMGEEIRVLVQGRGVDAALVEGVGLS